VVGGVVVLQAEVAAKLVDLLLRDRAGIAEMNFVYAAQHADRGVAADGLQIFEIVGVALHASVGAITVGGHALVAGDGRAVLDRGQEAGVGLEMVQARFPAAEAERRNERQLRARILGVERHGAAKRGVADGARRAWAAIHHDSADELGRKVAGRVVGESIVVAERNPVEGDVVAAVIDAANGGVLGLAQTGPVRLHVGNARGDVRDGRVVRRGRDVVGDIVEADRRLRLQRFERAVRRSGGERRSPRRGHFKFLEPDEPVFFFVLTLIFLGRSAQREKRSDQNRDGETNP